MRTFIGLRHEDKHRTQTNIGLRKKTNIGLRQEDKNRTQTRGQTQDSDKRGQAQDSDKRGNKNIKQTSPRIKQILAK